jgi:hypothetical protein
VKRHGARVVLEAPRRLLPLLSSANDIDVLVARGDDLPEFDVQSPLLSVPGIVKTSLMTIPADVPYLFADHGRVTSWQDKLQDVRGFRIGINWRGRPRQGHWSERDIPLQMFLGLGKMPGVRLVSLQRGKGREDLLRIPGNNEIRSIDAHPTSIIDLGDDVDTANGAFVDTAAIMKNLDLVITSDTAVAHLAGALAVPVWLALPYVADWRWFKERADSPWYPTMRLFRQQRAGDWATVFDHIRAELV